MRKLWASVLFNPVIPERETRTPNARAFYGEASDPCMTGVVIRKCFSLLSDYGNRPGIGDITQSG